ncbi:TetR family transcriptional regulator [Shinella curvata]|uniref:TetR family transcriptional regulator n=1 Tax=Shinella curvata TaxID=1817964 RepID=A0ABT8X7L9_9HYPH|nr:TetR/AcrR family transcriptional regulator [Shinella curvata]MCJ8052321.1 TetR family transcriptional regulator [Shinella curvata]MDO6119730.1 TetR family transcriptional regulator [Shinella curvata]
MNDTQMRRAPSQKRSRERLDAILANATEMIAHTGSDALRMSELAQRTGISIGSLYQYFPDKSAVVHALAERCNEESRACIAEGLSAVASMEDFAIAFGALIDTYYAIFLAEPVIRDIWSAVQADGALRAMEVAESRRNGALLGAQLKALRPAVNPAKIDATALLVMHLGEATMRLAVSVERAEGDALVESYKRMAIRDLTAL